MKEIVYCVFECSDSINIDNDNTYDCTLLSVLSFFPLIVTLFTIALKYKNSEDLFPIMSWNIKTKAHTFKEFLIYTQILFSIILMLILFFDEQYLELFLITAYASNILFWILMIILFSKEISNESKKIPLMLKLLSFTNLVCMTMFFTLLEQQTNECIDWPDIYTISLLVMIVMTILNLVLNILIIFLYDEQVLQLEISESDDIYFEKQQIRKTKSADSAIKYGVSEDLFGKELVSINVTGYQDVELFCKKTTVYQIEYVTSEGKKRTIGRSYREFQALYKHLQNKYRDSIMPQFPKKDDVRLDNERELQNRVQSFDSLMKYIKLRNIIDVQVIQFLVENSKSQKNKYDVQSPIYEEEDQHFKQSRPISRDEQNIQKEQIIE